MVKLITHEDIDALLDIDESADDYGTPFQDDEIPSLEYAFVKIVDAIRTAQRAGLSQNKAEKMIDTLCPECGSTMIFMYGCGWDYDRWICSQRGCHGDIELETTTGVEHD
jgi:hypothetical protein